MERKILVTGGVKSGKSRFAVEMARKLGEEILFIATARPIDAEMREKIERHKKERGKEFITIEEPIKLAEILKETVYPIAVIDCITLWLSNLFFELPDDQRQKEIMDFIETAMEFKGHIITVSNEVGWGIIPENRLSRLYQEELGMVNQKIASICSEVYLLVSGIPLRLK
ncbi:MAG: adenosylcobinamide kinase/adenosylcobinamide phosphate guanyltransferase [Deltaproteobacteria bacterium]|nr:MAG: adenosylcobinamide kinase/adenosylcobinamide phosphate guanyltransferase [Deltaproteobacteria bacterium]